MLGILRKRSLIDSWDIINGVHHRLYRLKTQWLYRPFFGHIGSRSVIRKPLLISSPSSISIGDDVLIRDGARLEIIRRDNKHVPKLVIGNRVSIEQHFHLVCSGQITIEDDVAFAARCTVVDTSHPFNSPKTLMNPGRRINSEPATIMIRQGAFIGIGATIFPNVEIGAGAVIGAHSVVTNDVPPYSVAAGTPARVIRSLCP